MSETPTLYAWLGGHDKLNALIERFYQQVPHDDLLAPVFAGMSPAHAQTVAAFIAEVFGGPKAYSGDGQHGHATMVAKHLGRHLSEAQRQRWMNLLLATADELELPVDPEFRSALVGYLEWGSRIAVINSQAHDNPLTAAAPMPRWGWGETGGPYTG